MFSYNLSDTECLLFNPIPNGFELYSSAEGFTRKRKWQFTRLENGCLKTFHNKVHFGNYSVCIETALVKRLRPIIGH